MVLRWEVHTPLCGSLAVLLERIAAGVIVSTKPACADCAGVLRTHSVLSCTCPAKGHSLVSGPL